MGDDTPNPLGLILRELDDIKDAIERLDAKFEKFEVRFGAHVDLDTARFQEIRDILMNWRGAAAMAMIFIPALVSLIVGIVLKHY